MSGGARGRLDTFFSRFMVEAYDRERDARLKFWRNNRLSKDVTDDSYEESQRVKMWRKRQEGVLVIPNEEVVTAARRREKRYHRNRHETMYDDAITARAKASQLANKALLPDMRPASPCTKRKLYEGLSHESLSHENKGRYDYLKERNKLDPHHKYLHPMTSNHEFGWRILELVPPRELKFSKYALTRLVEEEFYTRNYISSCQLHKNLYQYDVYMP